MRVYKNNLSLLKYTESYVNSKFPALGINKKQEVTRLLYEISKRDSTPPISILDGPSTTDFYKIKQYLSKIRYPFLSLTDELKNLYLPKLKLEERFIFDAHKEVLSPKRIFIEDKAKDSCLAKKFKHTFPKAKTSIIESLKGYLKARHAFTIEDYNKRRDTVFVTYENYDFFKACPCTKGAIRCGYNIFNLSFGCIFDCTYCYLQEYVNTPGLIFPANLNRFFDKFSSFKNKNMRIGTGEFSDSLMLDNVTEYSMPIIDFFKNHKSVLFEFKTKSKNIDNLLEINHAGNIVVAWSLNPQKIINENEFFTVSLKDRLLCAKKCEASGYKLAFHFDPVIYFEGWQKEYEKVIDMLFSTIKPESIAWISIGTLRFKPKVKQIIEARFPNNKILDEELTIGFDNKLRYPYRLRQVIYETMLKMLYSHSKKLQVYLCMEDALMWQCHSRESGNLRVGEV